MILADQELFTLIIEEIGTPQKMDWCFCIDLLRALSRK